MKSPLGADAPAKQSGSRYRAVGTGSLIVLQRPGRLGLAAELPRRHALEFLEQHEEVFGVLHADLPRDALDGLVGFQQQAAGLVHAKLVELIADGNARLRQILLAQIGGGNAHLLGDGLRADARVAETLLQPLVDLDHDLLRPVVLLGFLLAEQLFQPRLKARAHVLGRLRGGEQLFQRRPRRRIPGQRAVQQVIEPFEREQHIFIIFAFELLHELAEGDFFARFGGVEAGVHRRFQLFRALPGGFGGRLGENLLPRIEEAQLFAFQKSLIPRGQFGGRLNRQAVIAPAMHLRRQMQADIHRGLTGGRRAERQRRFADDAIRRFLRKKAAQTLVGGHFQQDRHRREAHEPFLRGLAVDPEPKRVLALAVERRRDDFFHLLGGLLHVFDVMRR